MTEKKEGFMKEYKYEEFVSHKVLVLFVCGSKIS